MAKLWEILDDEQGEIIICTDLKMTSYGWNCNPVARMDYDDDEEKQQITGNFLEIIASHNGLNK